MVSTPPLRSMVEALRRHYGPRKWWPAETRFEVMIGAVLTQNTAWRNVELAIANLRSAGLLDPHALRTADRESVETAIRPSGYYRQKARKLEELLKWFVGCYGASIELLRANDPKRLRKELLAIWGIGAETADAILCYALDFPVFVVDAYTVRLFRRHGLVDGNADYAGVQAIAHRALPLETQYLNEAHALMVEVGKRHCHKRSPDCANCPLLEFLDGDLPLDA